MTAEPATATRDPGTTQAREIRAQTAILQVKVVACIAIRLNILQDRAITRKVTRQNTSGA